MKQILKDLITGYATKNQSDFNIWLSGLSNDRLKDATCGLLTMYFNDLNSSALREYVTTIKSGFTPNMEKLGYNGYRDTYPRGKLFCETKPQNIRTLSNRKTKLNGSGSFNDFTWDKLGRHKRDNPTILASGFIDGRLVYIFRFAFNSSGLINRIKEQLLRQFPAMQDIPGRYLRSASFSFIHYKDDPSLETECFVNTDELDSLYQRKWITGKVYEHLQSFLPCPG